MKTVFALALFAASTAHAAPFLISDPWPTGVQPDACIATQLEGGSTRSLDLEVGETGRKLIREDLADAQSGSFTWRIVCTSNVAGVAPSAPVDFSFAIGTLAAPSGLRLAP